MGGTFSRSVGPTTLSVVRSDLVSLDVDALVNAANPSLLGGGDGAIHCAAGPALLEACRALGGCPTGEARLIPGVFRPARWIVYAVGVVWRGGRQGWDGGIAACCRASLTLGRQAGAQAIARPAIPTGVYGFAAERAAAIAVRSVMDALRVAPSSAVIFCRFNRDGVAPLATALREASLPTFP